MIATTRASSAALRALGRAMAPAAVALAVGGCFGAPPPAAPRERDPFDFAGTPCAAKPPSKACCEAAAKRKFVKTLTEDDGTGEVRDGIAGEFDALAAQALAVDRYRVHEAALGTACEAVLPVPLAFRAMRDMTPSQAVAELGKRAAAACARASKAAGAVTRDEAKDEARRAQACVYGGDEKRPDGCDALLGASQAPGVLEVVVCRDAREAVPSGARTLSELVPAVERVEAVEALATRAAASADELAAKRAWERAEVAGDDAGLSAARSVCKADRKRCEAACDKGEPRPCVALAWDHLRTARPPDFARARALLAAACGAKVARACTLEKALDEDEKRSQRAAADAYREVVEVAGEIALNAVREKEARATVVRSGELARSVDRMESYRAAVFTERLCPARKRFVASFGAAALAERVEKRCAHPELPAGVDLPAHEAACRELLARPCP